MKESQYIEGGLKERHGEYLQENVFRAQGESFFPEKSPAMLREPGEWEGEDLQTMALKNERGGKHAKKTGMMSVAEMGSLLGIKKTDRYWLLHKGYFETKIVAGKTWIDRDSFEYWYANQTRYHKVDGEEPGRELKERSYSPGDIAGMLTISEGTVYEIIRRDKIKTEITSGCMRVSREEFDRWYASQERYRTRDDRKRDFDVEKASLSMPDMARELGITRQQVYMLLKSKRYGDCFEIIMIAGRKRITRASFLRYLKLREREDSGRNNKEGDSGKVITVKAAAQIAGVSEATVRNWAAKGMFQTSKYGRTLSVDQPGLEGWLINRRRTEKEG